MPYQDFIVAGVPSSQQRSIPLLPAQWWPWGEPEPGAVPTLLHLTLYVPPCIGITITMISVPSSNDSHCNLSKAALPCDDAKVIVAQQP